MARKYEFVPPKGYKFGNTSPWLFMRMSPENQAKEMKARSQPFAIGAGSRSGVQVKGLPTTVNPRVHNTEGGNSAIRSLNMDYTDHATGRDSRGRLVTSLYGQDNSGRFRSAAVGSAGDWIKYAQSPGRFNQPDENNMRGASNQPITRDASGRLRGGGIGERINGAGQTELKLKKVAFHESGLRTGRASMYQLVDSYGNVLMEGSNARTLTDAGKSSGAKVMGRVGH